MLGLYPYMLHGVAHQVYQNSGSPRDPLSRRIFAFWFQGPRQVGFHRPGFVASLLLFVLWGPGDPEASKNQSARFMMQSRGPYLRPLPSEVVPLCVTRGCTRVPDLWSRSFGYGQQLNASKALCLGIGLCICLILETSY